ncbi:MAG: energy-dependent translational throttle protein EttA [Gammaproteobacteria bacterium]|nr:energy-dependent translational throttle protein EttA [Gammaproteobacteria bacterium]
MAEKTIFSMTGVTKIVPPQKEILKDIYLSFFYGAKIGVLGINGSGKSTLLKIIAGVDKEFNGEMTYEGHLKICYLPQEPVLDPNKTVRENIEDGLSEQIAFLRENDALLEQLGTVTDDDLLAKIMDRYSFVTEKIEHLDLWNLDRHIERASFALHLPPQDALVGPLSGGEKRRVALATVLLSRPDVLLLDEPTNHLDALSVSWLEQFLRDFQGTVIAVTHDRYFLDNVAGWILELDRGHGYPYQGNYSHFLELRAERLKQEKAKEISHQKLVEEELEWVRSGSKARQKKSKSRLAQFEELCSREFQQRAETQSLYIPPGPRLGQDVIRLENVSYHYSDGKNLMTDLSFTVPPGAIVGIIGPNGAGKSTLFKMIAGKIQPSAGVVHVGQTVKLAYVDQARDHLDDSKTVWEEISDGLDFITVGSYVTPSRAYVWRFNFSGSDQQKRIGSLSGGERNRVHLAKLLRSGGNVLLLDEPTNDLDVETLRALEHALVQFPGVALVISHDRWFLDRIATHVLCFDGEGRVEWFEGNFSEYAEYHQISSNDDKKKRYTKLRDGE